MPFTYEYPRPSVTVDVVLFTIRRGGLSILLIRRKNPPFKGHWALPGGFVDPDENLEHAAARELQEETGIVQTALTQLGAFGDPGRDPRGHTVSVAFSAFVVAPMKPVAADDAAEAEWVAVSTLKRARFAFDHARIIALALQRLREQLGETPPPPINLVPPRFTLPELRHVYQTVFGRRVDARTFRAKVQHLVERVSAGRAKKAQLYRWREPSAKK
jgi:8-oxo-dGTP diphosphatase